jgi:hypothetical protein
MTETRPLDLDELVLVAVSALARHGLEALREPNHRGGAVALKVLHDETGWHTNSIRRYLDRVSTDRVRRRDDGHVLLFDLAARHVLLDEPSRLTKHAGALKEFSRSQVDLGDLEQLGQVMRTVLLGAFGSITEQQSARDLVAASYVAQAAIIADDSAYSRTLAEFRQMGYDTASSVFLAGLRWLLRATHRRPRSPYRDIDLCDMLWSLFDGYMLRHLLDVERYPLTIVVHTMWDMSLAMTEPGLLNEEAVPGGDEGHAFISAVLAESRSGSMPDDVAKAAGDASVDPQLAIMWFTNAEKLHLACLDYALATRVALKTIREAMPQASRDVVVELLHSIRRTAEEYPQLVASLPNAPVWQELEIMIKDSFMEALGVEQEAIATSGAVRAVQIARDVTAPQAAWISIVDTILVSE